MLTRDQLSKLTKDELIGLVLELQKDKLTGVYKRDVLDDIPKMDKYIVAMVDINGLKEVNDTYGHDAGDDYITMVADNIRKVVRKKDYVIRYGGDEFIIVFRELSVSDAVKAVGRIDNASYGVGIGKTLDEAISKADKLMYKMKNRNKEDVYCESV